MRGREKVQAAGYEKIEPDIYTKRGIDISM